MTETIPGSMRALVLPAPGRYEIQNVPVPRPETGEVLCKVRGVAICGSDPEILRGIAQQRNGHAGVRSYTLQSDGFWGRLHPVRAGGNHFRHRG